MHKDTSNSMDDFNTSSLSDGIIFSYTRLFPGRYDYGFTEAKLQDLADSMRLGETALLDSTFSGMVYIGQFVVHDLTRDETKLNDAG